MNKNVCMSCLKRYNSIRMNTIKIGPLGYGSNFDGVDGELHICDHCLKETPAIWWELEKVDKELPGLGTIKVYKYDDEMSDYIASLPDSSQNQFYGINEDIIQAYNSLLEAGEKTNKANQSNKYTRYYFVALIGLLVFFLGLFID